MIHLTIIIAVILSAYVECVRIRAVLSKRLNVRKWVSITIGAGLFFLIVWIFGKTEPQAVWLAFEYACLRGVFYDPFLNRFRGLPLTYESDSTNSLLDKLQAKLGISFTLERILFALAAIIFGILYSIS